MLADLNKKVKTDEQTNNNTEMKSLTVPAQIAGDKQRTRTNKESKVEMNQDFKIQQRKNDKNMEERKFNMHIFVSLD